MDELIEFMAVLDAECVVLKKKEQIQPHVSQPWRYYCEPLVDENKHEHLRAVVEAGRHTVEAEACVNQRDELGAWKALAKAQEALLFALSSQGKRRARTLGHVRGGSSKNEKTREKIFYIADDLLAGGHPERGLASKVADKLGEDNIHLREDAIRNILKELKDMLDKR